MEKQGGFRKEILLNHGQLFPQSGHDFSDWYVFLQFKSIATAWVSKLLPYGMSHASITYLW